jgi:hypothetical protein
MKEVEIIWKEVFVAQSRFWLVTCLEGLRKSSRRVGILDKIRFDHLQKS